MREYGYPEGWLIEAQVSSDKLSVHNGDGSQPKDLASEDLADGTLMNLTKIILVGDCLLIIVIIKGEVKSPSRDPSLVEYDQNKIYSFMGFNEEIPTEFIDVICIYYNYFNPI